MERIFDVYTCRTQDLSTIMQTIKIGATQKSVVLLMQSIPTSSEQYPKMLIEQVSYDNNPGDLTSISVTYVGLFRDTSPKPLISSQPLEVSQYIHSPVQYTINFVQEIGEVGAIDELNFIRRFLIGTPAPASINGQAIPVSPVAPYRLRYDLAQQKFGSSGQIFNSGWFSGTSTTYEYTEQKIVNGVPTFFTITTSKELSYFGYAISGFSYERYGLVAEAIITISDSAILFGGLQNPVALNTA